MQISQNGMSRRRNKNTSKLLATDLHRFKTGEKTKDSHGLTQTNMKKELLYEDLTEKIIKCFYKVYDELGSGFLESVYEKSLIIELNNMGLIADNQKSLNIYYRNQLVGDFKADIIVEEKIIIEIKAVAKITTQHEA